MKLCDGYDRNFAADDAGLTDCNVDVYPWAGLAVLALLGVLVRVFVYKSRDTQGMPDWAEFMMMIMPDGTANRVRTVLILVLFLVTMVSSVLGSLSRDEDLPPPQQYVNDPSTYYSPTIFVAAEAVGAKFRAVAALLMLVWHSQEKGMKPVRCISSMYWLLYLAALGPVILLTILDRLGHQTVRVWPLRLSCAEMVLSAGILVAHCCAASSRDQRELQLQAQVELEGAPVPAASVLLGAS